MVLESLLNGIKERNFRGIAKQTEQLDPQIRQHLQEYLHSNLVINNKEEEELQELQDELYSASIKLKDLREKEEFIGTRLQAYQTKLKAIDDANNNDSTNNAKQEEHQKALEKIQNIHTAMKHNIKILESKMEKMEKRKLELQWHIEECQVVLDTAHQLERLETELAAEQATTTGTSGDVTDGSVVEMMDLRLEESSVNDGTIPVQTTISKKEEATNGKDDEDEEVGKIESDHDFEPNDNLVASTEEKEERISSDGLASRIAIADEQV